MSHRDRHHPKGQPRGDGRIPRGRKERPTPPDKEAAFKKTVERQAALGGPTEYDLLALVRDAETISREYHVSTLARSLATSYSAFNNQHAAGSKYLGPGFKGRSRLFVPKTRIAVRKNMATAAAALFSTDDVANVSAVYEDDPRQLAIAAVKKELLNYRLTRGNTSTSLNWFQICMGGILDAQLAAGVISKQHWEFTTVEDGEEAVEVDVLDDDTGEYAETVTLKRPIKRIVRDRPMIDLFPIENCSLDPAAPWYDPVGSGAWFRARYPMYLAEAKAMIESAAPEQGFLPVDAIDFSKGRVDEAERSSTRRAREGGRDRIQDSRVGEWEPIWLVENHFRVSGRDMHFWTIGETEFASKIRTTADAYPAFGGERPYKMGVAAIESHKIMPMAPVESWQQLQLELNDIANLRIDTLKRSIAPLTLVKRGRNVDQAALLRRGQPEAVVQVNDINDVEFTATPAPPGQAYTEASVTSNLFDEVAGVMSTSTVANNRQLNETVGGMKLLSGAANAVSEFDLRVIVETWVEPVLRQVSRLIDYYESDENALRVAGAKAQAWQRHGYVPNFQDLETTEVSIRVNVGIGSSDPMQRLAKMGQALTMLTPVWEELKGQGISLNGESLIEEIFGQAGFKDGRRFFTFGEPQQDMNPELMKIMEELKLKARQLDLTAQEMKLDFQSGREDRDTKLQISREEGQRELLQDLIDHIAGAQAREEGRIDGHIGRAADQNFQRENRDADQNFQRETKASDQGFQKETRREDQDFQRENRHHDTMESRVARLADFLMKPQGPDGKPGTLPKELLQLTGPQNGGTPQNGGAQPPAVPSGQDLMMQVVMQRMDQMQQAQQTGQQQMAAFFVKALSELAQAMQAPKQIVFGIGPDGRPHPVGVAPGAPSGALPPPRR